MIARILLGSFLASIVMFVWGFVFWGVSGIPVASGMIAPMPGEEAGTMALRMREFMDNAPAGVYTYPFPPAIDADEAAQQTFMGWHAAGPIFQIFYKPEGTPPMSPLVMAGGWLHMFLWCLVCATVLARVGSALGKYTCRLGVLTLIGLLASNSTNIGEAIWFPHPWTFRLGKMGYEFVGIFLASLILAAIVKTSGCQPCRVPNPATQP